MTRKEAVLYLRKYRREALYNSSSFKRSMRFLTRSRIDFKNNVMAEFLVDDLIRQIQRTEQDPIELVRDFYYQMDEILCTSEQSKTWEYTCTMENIASDILSYLREKEKERHGI